MKWPVALGLVCAEHGSSKRPFHIIHKCEKIANAVGQSAACEGGVVIEYGSRVRHGGKIDIRPASAGADIADNLNGGLY